MGVVMSRYIDADKIKWHKVYCNGGEQHIAYQDEIENMPTEDVAPTVLASWMPKENIDAARCSNCSCRFFGREHAIATFIYCPRCGAKMDKEVE